MATSQNSFFTTQQEQLKVLGYSGFGTTYLRLKPKGSGVVDVFNKMRWKNGGTTEEIPAVWITEKELKYGVWTANLLQFLSQLNNLGAGQGLDSYLNLYAAEKTGFEYCLPLLTISNGGNIRTVRNQWVPANGVAKLLETKAGTSGGVGDLAGAAVGFVTGVISPGFGYEETFQYAKTDSASLQVTFPLYNTFDLKSTFDHYSFVQLITFQNLKTRTSMLTFIPPKIYTVDTVALGGIYMAAAYISELKIDSIGTTRRMSDFFGFGSSELLIPEAYKVSITFTDLVSQSSNIFAGTMGGAKIEVTGIPQQVINQGAAAAAEFREILNSAQTAGTTATGQTPPANDVDSPGQGD